MHLLDRTLKKGAEQRKATRMREWQYERQAREVQCNMLNKQILSTLTDTDTITQSQTQTQIQIQIHSHKNKNI